MWREYPGPLTAVLIACSTVTTFATKPAPTCSEAVDGRHQLRVRIIPGTMDPAVMSRVRAEVEAIWNRYRIDVVWEPPRASAEQALPDLWVQFVEGRFPSTGGEKSLALGRLKFDEGVPTHRIQMSRMAAEALLATTSWAGGPRALLDGPDRLRSDALGRIVGRALAHEIGHYLLASPTHAGRGLMRAVIYPKDLVSPDTSILTLTDADVHVLRAARVARCEGARQLAPTAEGARDQESAAEDRKPQTFFLSRRP